VQSLASGDAQAAYDKLCANGREELADPAALKDDFETFLGGQLQSGRVTDAVGADGDDYVTIAATLDSGQDREFAVKVVQEGGQSVVCGYVETSDIP
jgi:hypothetical protein